MPPLKIVLAEDNPNDVTLVHMARTGAGLNVDLVVLADDEQAEYMRLGTIMRDFFFSRKTARCQISDFPLKEGGVS